MKKIEAEMLAPEKIDTIMEYIMQILEDSEKVSAKMIFNIDKIEGKAMNTLDIYVPKNDFEKHLNLGITNDHRNVLLKEFLNRVVAEIFPLENIGASNFYSVRGTFDSFDGIGIFNSKGSSIYMDMYGVDEKLTIEYNKSYEEFKKSYEESAGSIKY